MRADKITEPLYLTAQDDRVLIKNRILYALNAVYLIWIGVTHDSLYGMLFLAAMLLFMYLGCCGFSGKSVKPLYSLKHRAGSYLFYTVLSISGIFLFHDLQYYLEALKGLLHVFTAVQFYLLIVLFAAGLIFSPKIENPYAKKTVRYVSSGSIAVMMLYAVGLNAAMIALAVLLTLLFYLYDCALLTEAAAVSGGTPYVRSSGAFQHAVCSAAALFVFAPYSEQWMADWTKPFSRVLGTIPMFYLLPAAAGMILLAAKYYQNETIGNNESAAFILLLSDLILLKLMLLLPFRFAFVVPAVYTCLSLAFLTAVGEQSLLARFAAHTGYASWVLQLVLSGLALAAYLLLSQGMWICTVVTLLSVYLLMTGSMLSFLNQQRFRWHGYLAVLYLLCLGCSIDLKVLRTLPACICLAVMLMLQAAFFIWDYQYAAEQKAFSLCSGKTADILKGHHVPEKQQKFQRTVKLIVTGCYGIFCALLLRKLLQQ